jgi:hypothetical protein
VDITVVTSTPEMTKLLGVADANKLEMVILKSSFLNIVIQVYWTRKKSNDNNGRM